MKKSSIILFLFLYPFFLLPITVGSIAEDEGIWNVLTRVGQATNIIESKVCNLDIVLSPTFIMPPCDFLIEQTDIPITITTGGNYCLNENISVDSNNDAITINADNVLLDLTNHKIDGTNQTGGTAVQLGLNVNNITIANGTIKDMGANGIATSADVSSIHRNITVRNINFIDCASFAVTMSGGQLTERFFMDDCRITGNDAGANGIVLEGVVEGTISRCHLQQCAGIGIEIRNADRIDILGCIFDDGPQGIVVTNALYVLIQNCIARNMAYDGFALHSGSATMRDVVFDNCLTQSCGDSINGTIGAGFCINGSTGSGAIQDVILRNCVAQECLQEGYLVESSSSSIQSLLFDNCSAFECGRDGFRFEQTSTTMEDIILRRCRAIHNSSLGFNINTSGTTLLTDCIAQNNGFHGIDLASTTTQCKVFKCYAMSNTGTGINNRAQDANIVIGNASLDNIFDVSGISDGTMTVPRSTMGALAGASRWVNAVS